MQLPTINAARTLGAFATALSAVIVFQASRQLSAEQPADATIAKPADTAELYEIVKPAFVEMLIDGHMAGSGAFVDKQGYIITASHVLGRPGRRIEALSPTYGRLKAEFVAVDVGHDLALLKVTPRAEGYAALAIAKETPAIGQMCYLIGTPLYRHALLLPGTVARREPGFEFMPNSKSYAEVYYVAGPSPPGTSGGAWVNADGELVGVQSMLMSVLSSAHGISFVVPPMAIAKLLKNKRSASTPSLATALEEVWQHVGEVRGWFAPDAEGLFVRASKKNCPARKAGLKEWDLIQSIDGKPVARMDDLVSHILTKKPGDAVVLVVISPNEQTARSVSVPLVELEKAWSSESEPAKTPEKSTEAKPAPAEGP